MLIIAFIWHKDQTPQKGCSKLHGKSLSLEGNIPCFLILGRDTYPWTPIRLEVDPLSHPAFSWGYSSEHPGHP